LRDWHQVTKRLIFDRDVLKDFFFCNRDEFFRRKKVAQAYRFFSKDTLENLFALDNVIMVAAGERLRTFKLYSLYLGGCGYGQLRKKPSRRVLAEDFA
jgi:hypothetical protein